MFKLMQRVGFTALGNTFVSSKLKGSEQNHRAKWGNGSIYDEF